MNSVFVSCFPRYILKVVNDLEVIKNVKKTGRFIKTGFGPCVYGAARKLWFVSLVTYSTGLSDPLNPLQGPLVVYFL